MSEQIKKSDISEQDIYGWIRTSAVNAKAQIEELNTSLKESANISKTILTKNSKMSEVSELKATEQAIKTVNDAYKNKIKLEIELNNIEAKRLRAERLLNTEQERRAKATDKVIQNEEKLASAYSRVDKWLTQLIKEYKELAIKKELGKKLTEDEEKRYTTLTGRIQKYDDALKKVDATSGKFQRNVGNYASGWNGLGNTMNQLTREAPAFANSIQTGFMAISNNLPMLFDEIKKIGVANKELRAQGQPTVSTFRQIGSAIFSFGTLLSAGITLLTLYGKEIIAWVSGVEDAAEKQERLNRAIAAGNKAGEKSIKDIERKLAWDKMTRKEAIERLKEEINQARRNRQTFQEEALQAKKSLDNTSKMFKFLNIFEEADYNNKQKRLKALQGLKIGEENLIFTLNDKLKALRLEEYQDSKNSKNKLKNLKAEKQAYKEVTDALNQYNQEEEDFAKKQDDQFNELINGLLENQKYIESLQLSDQENELLQVELHYKRLYDLAELFGEDTTILKESELNKKNEINLKYAQKELDETEKANKAIEDADNDHYDKMDKMVEEKEKNRFKKSKEYVDLIANYFIKRSEDKIKQLDKEIKAAEDQQTYLQNLAENGNITAQQSLANNDKKLEELNQKKLKQQKQQERIKLAQTALEVYSNKSSNGDKNPLVSTITEIALLQAFINSLPSFKDGTENTFNENGKGIDGKGGKLSILHKNERVVPEEINDKLNGISNKQLGNIVSEFQNGNMVLLNKKTDIAGNSFDIAPLLSKFDSLEKTIKNMPIGSVELGKVTREVFQVVESVKRGNVLERNVSNIRKR